MSPFAATNKAPGVYIEEVQSPGPIAGVATSTVAIIGPARNGPINTPTRLTNWTQFQEIFGLPDQLGPYLTTPLIYAPHAVRGFFDEGGKNCYFVRVGTAARAARTLNDRATPTPRPALVVTARREGTTGNAITVQVQDASLAPNVAVTRAQGTIANASGTQATLTAAASDFRPGDTVLLEQAATNERAQIASISGSTVTLTAPLVNTYTGGTLRIANLVPGQRTLRVANTAGIESGSLVTLTQGTTTEGRVVQSVERTNNFVTLAQELTNSYTMAGADPAVTLATQEFTLIVNGPGGAETFASLSMDPRHSRYVLRQANSTQVDIALPDTPSPTAPPLNRPAVLAASALAGGLNDDAASLQTSHYRTAIDTLERVDDISIVCVPDRTDKDIQGKLIAHCEKMQDRFAILDPQPGATAANVTAQRNELGSENGYAALYYPWLVIGNPVAEGTLMVPPSGHIAGVFASTDNRRGVHKAPANETIRSALAPTRVLTDDEQGPLNEQGINVLRSFAGRGGVVIWGARTLAKDRTQWRYINVRRLMLFIQESIQEGTQFAIFEPNDLALWEQVKRQVTEFLTRVWRDGALFGATPSQAFQVRVDEELNPPSTRALGQLVLEVRVYPVTPAEFIVFRVIQEPGGPRVQE